MPDVVLIVTVGTALLLLLGVFIAFMTLTYQKRRLKFHKQLRDLSETYQKEILKAQIEMQEQTFLSISQEIHDNVGQTLSLVRLNMSTLEDKGSAIFQPKIRDSKELLDLAIEDLRHFSKRLNSNYASQQSLSELLSYQLGLIEKTGAFKTSFSTVGKEHRLDPEKKLIIFRIAQESFNNIIKHAEASLITVQLIFTEENLKLGISDNGKGFVPSSLSFSKNISQGTGTYNMEFRAKLIGGSLQIESKIAAGTQIILTLPLK